MIETIHHLEGFDSPKSIADFKIVTTHREENAFDHDLKGYSKDRVPNHGGNEFNGTFVSSSSASTTSTLSMSDISGFQSHEKDYMTSKHCNIISSGPGGSYPDRVNSCRREQPGYTKRQETSSYQKCASDQFHPRLPPRPPATKGPCTDFQSITNRNSRNRQHRASSPVHCRLANHTTKSFDCRVKERQETPPRPRSPFPFHTVVKSNSFCGTDVSSITRSPRSESKKFENKNGRRKLSHRDSSPIHDRLAAKHTKSSVWRMEEQKNMQPRIETSSPFYTVVGSNSSCDSDNSPSTEDYRKGRNRITGVLPPQSSYTRPSKGALKDNGPKPRNVIPASKQDALFYRLSKVDTVSSSKMKSSPSHLCLTKYEKRLKAEELSKKKGPVRRDDSVYNRLVSQGMKSSLRKLMLGQQRYNGHETMAEGCRTVLLR